MAQALIARGHKVTVLVPSWDWPADAGRSWVENGVRIECLPLPAKLPLLFHLAVTQRLVRRAMALRPDVVHFFKPKSYAGLVHWFLVALRRLSLNDARLVVDADDWEQAWNPVAGYPNWQRHLFTWQERWGLRHADAVTLASHNLQELAIGIGVSPERIYYVPNGIRPALAPMMSGLSAASSLPAERPRDGASVRLRHNLGGDPVILLYTRFAEFELARLVSLVGQLAGRVPSARWLVVGQGFAGEEHILAGQLRAVGLDRLVVLAGWVPAQDLPDYFAAADVAAFPFDDNPINRARCSVKLIDLLAAGLPVVTDAVGENKAYIIDRETGLLVPPGDTDAFAARLVGLLDDPVLCRQLGNAGRQRMLQHFAWPVLVEAVEEAYHS
jgi:glycosyltransferase involved in cell wall biosynthesis